MATILGLLVLTYVALLYFVRAARSIIDEEQRAREQAAVREQEWHRDKMATLGRCPPTSRTRWATRSPSSPAWPRRSAAGARRPR